PALRITNEHTARINVAASSSSDALSSNQNDGNVKNKVTMAENANGKIRSPNRKLAEFALDSWFIRLMLGHAITISKDKGQYMVAKNARETRRPRAANITPALPS
ncbi:MAG: hypothetical protein WBE52_04060, partial [Terriglobales bacterium]